MSIASLLAGLAINSLPCIASGVGNRVLDAEIIRNPVPGATPYSKSELTAYVRYLQGLELVASKGKRTVAIAAKGWHTTATPRKYVLVTLIAIEDPTITPDGAAVLAGDGARQATQSFCAGASNTAPFLNKASPLVPHGSYVICGTSSAGTNDEAIMSWRHNVIVVVSTTIQTLSPATLESITLNQYGALGQNAASTAHPSSGGLRRTIGLVAAGAAATLVVVLAVAVRNDRRRRAAPRHRR